MIKHFWKFLASATVNIFNKKQASCIRIGDYELALRLDNKHEIAYHEKHMTNITDVDVAIARILLRKGDVALDLGANIGYVSLNLLHLGASEVHAFEPSPEIYKRLKRLRAFNLHCYPYAIGERSGEGELTLSVSHHQGSTLYPQVVALRKKVYGDQPDVVKVQIRAIDQLFPDETFDYVKVDIEGGELDFVKGAQVLLKSRPPRVLVLEIKPEFKQEYLEALAPYFSCAYRVDYDKTSGNILLVDVDAPVQPPYRNQPPNYVFTNDAHLLQ